MAAEVMPGMNPGANMAPIVLEWEEGVLKATLDAYFPMDWSHGPEDLNGYDPVAEAEGITVIAATSELVSSERGGANAKTLWRVAAGGVAAVAAVAGIADKAPAQVVKAPTTTAVTVPVVGASAETAGQSNTVIITDKQRKAILKTPLTDTHVNLRGTAPENVEKVLGSGVVLAPLSEKVGKAGKMADGRTADFWLLDAENPAAQGRKDANSTTRRLALGTAAITNGNQAAQIAMNGKTANGKIKLYSEKELEALRADRCGKFGALARPIVQHMGLAQAAHKGMGMTGNNSRGDKPAGTRKITYNEKTDQGGFYGLEDGMCVQPLLDQAGNVLKWVEVPNSKYIIVNQWICTMQGDKVSRLIHLGKDTPAKEDDKPIKVEPTTTTTTSSTTTTKAPTTTTTTAGVNTTTPTVTTTSGPTTIAPTTTTTKAATTTIAGPTTTKKGTPTSVPCDPEANPCSTTTTTTEAVTTTTLAATTTTEATTTTAATTTTRAATTTIAGPTTTKKGTPTSVPCDPEANPCQ